MAAIVDRQAIARSRLAAGLLLGVVASVSPAHAASPYVVASYPVDSTAADAVAAKTQGTSEAEQGALRYLMKRLVPVTSYRRLPKLPLAEIDNLLDGVSVRSEQNSPTEYVATLDFSFRADAVRNLLVAQGLPYLDRQAPTLTIIPVFAAQSVAAAAAPAGLAGQKAWRQAWSGLDLVHALTPVKLAVAGPSSTNDTFLKLIAGDRSRLGVVQAESSADRLLLAIASPSADGGKLTVALVGDDWSGPIDLRRTYTLYYKDLSYTAEFAAVIALGVLEGRWKETQGVAGAAAAADDANWSPAGDAAAVTAGAGQPIRMTVEFASLQQWQDMRARLGDVAGPQNVQVGAISARGAEVIVTFSGGPDALQSRLTGSGIALAGVDGHLVLRAAN